MGCSPAPTSPPPQTGEPGSHPTCTAWENFAGSLSPLRPVPFLVNESRAAHDVHRREEVDCVITPGQDSICLPFSKWPPSHRDLQPRSLPSPSSNGAPDLRETPCLHPLAPTSSFLHQLQKGHSPSPARTSDTCLHHPPRQPSSQTHGSTCKARLNPARVPTTALPLQSAGAVSGPRPSLQTVLWSAEARGSPHDHVWLMAHPGCQPPGQCQPLEISTAMVMPTLYSVPQWPPATRAPELLKCGQCHQGTGVFLLFIIKKQRHYFTNKGPSSEGYGFSSGHVWM